jgi:hypothetical protein
LELLRHRERLVAGGGRPHVEADELQARGEQVGDVRLVVDDEELGLGTRLDRVDGRRGACTGVCTGVCTGASTETSMEEESSLNLGESWEPAGSGR